MCVRVCSNVSNKQAQSGMQVYVSVYADGPTRVLRFADEKSTALLEAEQSILDLAARLKQVCCNLKPA